MSFKFPSISGFGPADQLVNNFSNSLNNIFGLTPPGGSSKLSVIQQLVAPEANASADHSSFNPLNWTGNTSRVSNKLRYGFQMIELDAFKNGLDFSIGSTTNDIRYYLDIPPQAISQKEVFATNISATRRGVVVESEGVVFKDIVIAGTTGVFPGKRDGFGQDRANFSDITKAPKKAAGVLEDGTSGSDVNVSGYAEFLGLRAFFLKYAQRKIQKKGELFLAFINEKDQQTLVVEPLEFVMERNSKNPLQYQYRIVLKAIATLDAVFADASLGAGEDAAGLLTDIVNVSRNASAAINQFRAALAATNQLVQGISQEIDKTFVQPLRLLSSAFDDVAEARNNILAVPTVLSRNLNNALLSIAEDRYSSSKEQIADKLVGTGSLGSTTNATTTASTNNTVSTGKISERGSSDFNTSNKLLDKAKAQSFVDSSIASLENSAFEPLSRAFVQDLRDEAQKLADDIADVLNLGNASYDVIKNRTNTNPANPLKVATPNEYLLLGATLRMIDTLNAALATNSLYFTTPENDFARDQELLNNITVINVPQSVKNIVIRQNDTLEKISLREYGNTARWVEIARLNNLKYPYIAETAEDGVKAYGDKLLVSNA
jgi:nucleoid-associated protein YgaU